jgi:hypothetical protein
LIHMRYANCAIVVNMKATRGRHVSINKNRSMLID